MTRQAVFVVEELNPFGNPPPPGGFARFEWTRRNKNIPVRPWTFGVRQRSIRTDYPGANDPTEQVLGGNFKPFTVSGRWDDRYNPQAQIDPALLPALNRETVGGYARAERERFENMVLRGNPVRITFESITIQGVITDCDFDYRREWDIGYSFTMSPHHRQPGGFFALSRSPRAALNVQQFRGEVATEIEAVEASHAVAPQLRLVAGLWSTVNEQVENLRGQLDVVDLAIDQRDVSPTAEANSALRRIATAFAEMSTTSQALIDALRGFDSSEALDREAAIPTLNFNLWSRGVMSSARRVIVSSQRAAADVSQRVDTNASRLYRPYAGQHLYDVSLLFYGTAFNWKRIFERNRLTSTTLTGNELLIIPENLGR